MKSAARRGLAAALAASALSLGLGVAAHATPDCGTAGMCQCATEWRCYVPGSSCDQICGRGSGGGGGAGSGGLTPQQQMVLQGFQILLNSAAGDRRARELKDAEEAREKARQRAEAERLRQENERRFAEKKARILGQMSGGAGTLSFKGDDQPGAPPAAGPAPADIASRTAAPAASSSSSLRFKDDSEAESQAPLTKDPRFKNPTFSKGYEAASRCFSANSGPACADVSGEQAEVCLNDYRAGFEVGRKKAQEELDHAARKGAGAAMSGLPNEAASDPDSNGDCRTQWVEAYNRGYFQTAKNTGRK